MKVSRFLVIAIVAVSALIIGVPVSADVMSRTEGQNGIVLENVETAYRFGWQITFLASIQASTPIQSGSIVILDEG